MPLYRDLRRRFGNPKKSIVLTIVASWVLRVVICGLIEFSKSLSQSYCTIFVFITFGLLTLYSALGDLELNKEKGLLDNE